MNVAIPQITQTSPLRHFLQGLESSDSTDESENEMTCEDLAQIQNGTARLKLVISFKNPFKPKETIVQNLNATSTASSPARHEITFCPKIEPIFFSRGHEGRWSKIALVFIKNVQERITIDTYRQYAPQPETVSCSSLNGRLLLMCQPITAEEKRILLPKARRCLFPDENSPIISLNIRPAALEAPSLEQCLQIGLVTKIVGATLSIPLPTQS